MDSTIIQLRNDTSGNWVSVNPTLMAGEAGVETDTGKIKIGNGSTPWTTLPYSTSGSISVLNYNECLNKPSINSVELLGNVSLSSIGAVSSTELSTAINTEATARQNEISDLNEEIQNTNVYFNQELQATNALLETVNESVYGSPTILLEMNGSSAWVVGETVTGQTSNATASIVSVANGNPSVNNVVGTFVAGETVTGDSSGVSDTLAIIVPGNGILNGLYGHGRLNSIEDLLKTGSIVSATNKLTSSLPDGNYVIKVLNGQLSLVVA